MAVPLVANTYEMQSLGLSPVRNTGESMYLGQWREAISNKLKPDYFKQLEDVLTTSEVMSFQTPSGYLQDRQRFVAPIFNNEAFKDLLFDSDVLFSFVSEKVTIAPQAFNQLNDTFTPDSGFQKAQSKLKIVEQSFYTPGYVFSRGGTSVGVAAVLLQQRFIDDSFGVATFASTSNFQPFDDQSFVTSNRGTGYRFNVSQSLPAKMNLTFDYRSQIYMNEFDTLGRSYTDPGDFDIPSQYTLSLDMPVKSSMQMGVSAEKISYNSVDPIVHSGYSASFLRVFNSPISPIFKLRDLTVYTVSFKQDLSERFSWNVFVTSRQQPSATARIYDRILKNDTASVTYRLGISHRNEFGQFDLFASFANKPILIGNTDFGRLSSTSLNSHIEGVASWSYRF